MILDKLATWLRQTRHERVRNLAKAIYYGMFRRYCIARHRRRLLKQYEPGSLPLIRADALLGAGPYELSHYTFAPWSPTPLEYALVQGLARRFRPCHFLEIGSLRGELLANLNAVVESSTGITLSKEDIAKMGFPRAIAETTMMFASDIKNLQLIYANSAAYDFSQLPHRYNVAFVDGEHLYEFVKSDTKNVWGVCAKEFAIVWHDYTVADHTTINWEVFAGILDGLPRELWSRLYHVNNTTCAVLLPEAWNIQPHEHVFYPERVYTLTISARELSKS